MANAVGPVNTVFTFSGGEQVYHVPVATTAVHVVAVGAPGGDGADGSNSGTHGHGGLGALVDGNVPVTPGGVLFVEVGAPGGLISESGGFGGAGVGVGGAGAGGASGSGGGASDVRTCSVTAVVCPAGSTLDSRLLIAGGGGGGGGGTTNVAGNGGDAGSDGQTVISGPTGGGAGRFSTPCMSNAGTNAQSGSLGFGGMGGVPPSSTNYGAGGGGGGGLCGGGGGGAQDLKPGAGGGGGSSFFGTNVTDLPVTTATTSTPSVTVTYTDQTAPSVGIKAPGNGDSYPQFATVDADYQCSDDQGGAGVASCAGPIASGQPIDTSTLGVHHFAVTTTDNVGNTITRTVDYTVVAAAAKIASLSQSASRWREGSKLPTVARAKPPVGTTFKVSLDRPATVRFAFTQRRAGRRAGGKCVKPTRRNAKKRHCTRTVTAGALTFPGRAGLNTVRFQGRLGKHKRLKPGKYTLVVTATTAQGLKSGPKRLKFTIAR